MLIRRLYLFISFLNLFAAIGLVYGHDQALTMYRQRFGRRYQQSYPTIVVDQSGRGNFKTIQSAIDSLPARNNTDWVCIQVKAGKYNEQVHIPPSKQFIYLKGEGKKKTIVVSSGSLNIATSPTFNSEADNILVRGMSFWNSYNNPFKDGKSISPAVAARIIGDKAAFYRCGFYGFQDTLWDVQGRHYFKQCSIQGAVDFIFGAGQSLYEKCTISVITRGLKGMAGYITAQGRTSAKDTNGFVFKDCNVVGNGLVYLGRPWRDYARVIFYNTSLPSIVVPEGWHNWNTQLSASTGYLT
ncbi:probable pectinesterase 29 [Impatiens glandulifera]|uniref:probable pectinesterase 29 n=1 Tax=Impatiens glandulifera TaxID=253017 RepID=UPI001FB05FB1|nr:probable pectinesterase 29 [Impatiens glandulifera]